MKAVLEVENKIVVVSSYFFNAVLQPDGRTAA
jgi:hypothetical protein